MKKNKDKNLAIAVELGKHGVPHSIAIKALNTPIDELLKEMRSKGYSGGVNDEQIKRQAKAQAILREKGKRFSISSRLLTGQEITCQVIDDKKQMPASYDLGTKELMLNEAFPDAKTHVDALTYDRGKLFHEVSHAKWTNGEERNRIVTQKQVNDVQAFLDMSNFIEDGRIERLAKQEWNGSAHYLDALLDSLVDTMDKEPIGALPVYVRTGLWRNKADEKFWAPYKDRIDAGIIAKDTDEVCRLSQSIVNEMCQKRDEQPQPQPDNNGKDKGEGERQGQGDGKGGSGKGDSRAEAKADSGGQETAGKSDATDVLDAVREIAEKAKEACRVESKETLDSIIDAVENEKQEQEFSDAAEENVADELATMLRSLLTEKSRKTFNASREGVLNTSALVKALTNRRCFNVKQKALGVPHVALLLDTSGSMRSSAEELTTAARIINGALQKTGIASKVVSFNSLPQVEPVVSIAPLWCSGGTCLAPAMQIANDWFESEQAERPLMVVITDGQSCDIPKIRDEKQRCENSNGFILGVAVGDIASVFHNYPKSVQDDLTVGFHENALVANITRLPEALEPKLLDYIAGS